MSTRHETYLLHAIQLDAKKYFAIGESCTDAGESLYDLSLPWCGRDSVGKFGILADGMGGRYCLAGKVLACDNEEGDETFGLIDLLKISEPDYAILAWCEERGISNLINPDSNPSLFLVSHYH